MTWGPFTYLIPRAREGSDKQTSRPNGQVNCKHVYPFRAVSTYQNLDSHFVYLPLHT